MLTSTPTRDSGLFTRLSKRGHDTIKALLSSEAAAKAIEEVEAEKIVQREELISELHAIERKANVEYPKLFKRFEDADAAMAKLEAELKVARGMRQAAKVDAENSLQQTRRFDLERTLRDSADERFNQFIFWMGQIVDMQIPWALESWFDHSKRPPLFQNNIGDVGAAREAIRQVRHEIEALQLKALTYSQVSEILASMCERLAPALAAVKLNPPSLSASDCEPGFPVRWGGESVWIVDAKREYTREDAAVDADMRKHRENNSK